MGGTKAATPWGPAALVDELTVRQQAGERRFASVVQLLEMPSGERLVRFAYSTDGLARAGPSPCASVTSSGCARSSTSTPTSEPPLGSSD